MKFQIDLDTTKMHLPITMFLGCKLWKGVFPYTLLQFTTLTKSFLNACLIIRQTCPLSRLHPTIPVQVPEIFLKHAITIKSKH